MSKLKLLLLEDESLDADLIKKVLNRSGLEFDMDVATDRNEYVQAIGGKHYDAILADNSLPQFDASGALKLIREQNLDVPFILVTGTISEDFAVKMMKEGASDYILKDRLQRLPSAIRSTISTYLLQAKEKKYLVDTLKNAELLKESERLAHIGSWEADYVTKTTIWSDENYRILGYEPGSVTPSLAAFLDRVCPDEREIVERNINQCLTSKTGGQFTCRVLCPQGITRHLENQVFVSTDDQGNLIRVNGFARDITDQVHSAERLQQSEANLKTIFNITETAFLLLDTNLCVVSFNQLADKFLSREYGIHYAEGENVLSYFTEDRRQRISSVVHDALDGKTSSYDIPYLQPSGLTTWYQAIFQPVWNNNQKVIGVLSSQIDITIRKDLEIQERKITTDLLQRNSNLEQFAYIVSHNLRGPVATILGISNCIKDDLISQDDRDMFIDGLIDSVKKLDGVITDLNNIIQTKSAVNVKKEPVSFTRLLREVAAGLKAELDNGTITLNHDFSAIDSMTTIKGYMYSIFYNLISNSVKYRRHDLPLVIEVRSTRILDKVELIFTDNGIGIDLKKRGDQVFGLYRRFHPDHAEGKGMGLFMVKTQVESLGGRISLESEVNAGTKFRIEFEKTEIHS